MSHPIADALMGIFGLSRLRKWEVEYEVPPLRAIYRQTVDTISESDAREEFECRNSLLRNYRIRKVTAKDS